MTIVFGGRVILFRDPDPKDVALFDQMRAAREKWEREGQPASGGFG